MIQFDLPRILTHSMYCPIDGGDLEWDNADLRRARVCSKHGAVRIHELPAKPLYIGEPQFEFHLQLRALGVSYDGDGVSIDPIEQMDSFDLCPFCKTHLHEHPHLRLTVMCRNHGRYSLEKVETIVTVTKDASTGEVVVTALPLIRFSLRLDAQFLRPYRLAPA